MSAPENSILRLASSGDAAALMRELRVRSLYSPYYFVKVVLGYNKLTDHFHHVEMERFTSLWSRGTRKQAIEWARGFYKTTCFTIGTAIWHVLPVTDEDSEYAVTKMGWSESDWFLRTALHDQDATQLLAFEVEENASKKVGIIKKHFEENVFFRQLFPEIGYTGKEEPWNTKCLRIRRVGARQRDAEGTFEAIGVGGSLQSRHYKTVWEDDLVGEKARNSQGVMEKTIEWHGRLNGAFESALDQMRFLVSNRWGWADLNSYVRENEPDVVFHTRSAIEINQETGKEYAVFPEEYPLEDTLRPDGTTRRSIFAIRDSASMTPYDFSCQYLNTPRSPGERQVDIKAIHTYRVEKDGQIVCGCGFKCYPSGLNRYMHYDAYNAKGAGSTSRPAIVVVGTASDKHVILLDYFLGKEDYGGVYKHVFKANDTWRPLLMTYEDVGHQNLTQYHIREIEKTTEYKKAGHLKFPRIIGVPTGNRTKEYRIRQGLFPVIEEGKFAVRKSQQTLMDMLETFPHPRFDHDYDLLDALAQGASLWRYPENVDQTDRLKREEDEYLRHFGQNYTVGVA